jgi:hypothetical protein
MSSLIQKKNNSPKKQVISLETKKFSNLAIKISLFLEGRGCKTSSGENLTPEFLAKEFFGMELRGSDKAGFYFDPPKARRTHEEIEAEKKAKADKPKKESVTGLKTATGYKTTCMAKKFNRKTMSPENCTSKAAFISCLDKDGTIGFTCGINTTCTKKCVEFSKNLTNKEKLEFLEKQKFDAETLEIYKKVNKIQ